MIIWRQLNKQSRRSLCRGCCKRLLATVHVEVVNDQMPPIEYNPPKAGSNKNISSLIDRVGQLWPADGKFVTSDENQQHSKRLYRSLRDLVYLFKNPPNQPRIAIIRDPSTHDSLLDSLLADPFASDQASYDNFRGRNPAKSSIIRFGPTFDHQITNSFQIFSFPHTLLQRTNVEFVEIIAVGGKEERFIDNTWQILKSCHLHVYTCPKYLNQITGFPTIHVIKASDDDDVLQNVQDKRVYCDISLAEQAVKLLRKSPSNISIYTREWESSGITRLEEAMHLEAKSSDEIANLLQLDVARAITQLTREFTPPETEISNEILPRIQRESGKVSNAREKWAESAHSELQTCLGPQLEYLIKSEIPWYSLYYQIADVSEISELYLRKVFFNKPDKQLAYLLGEIDATRATSSQQQGNSNNGDCDTPISSALDDIIENEIPKLQSAGTKALAETVLGMQTPVVIISILGFLLCGFSLYSMGAIASLGIMIGFNRLSNRWKLATELFKQSVLDKAHIAIIQSDQVAFNRWQHVLYTLETDLVNQSKLVNELESALGKKICINNL